jgi:hypothetical protein
MPFFHYIEGGRVRSRPANGADPALLAEMAAQGAVIVQELVLKDNDCGVAKDNHVKLYGLLPKLRHVDPRTYARIQRLAAQADSAELQDYFTQELLFSPIDVKSVTGNLKSAAKILKDGCQAGWLRLDLDIEAHLGLAADAPAGCDAT